MGDRLIRVIRRGQGKGLRTVASDTGIDLGTLSRFERGQRGLSEGNLVKLAHYYGLPIDTVLQRLPEPQEVPA